MDVVEVLRKAVSGSYRSKADLESDLSRISNLTPQDRNRIVGAFEDVQRSSSRNSSSALKSLSDTGNKIQNGLKTVTDLGFSTLIDQKYSRSLVSVAAIQGALNSVIDNGLNVIGQLGNAVGLLLKGTTAILEDAFQREADVLTTLTEKAGLAGDIAKGLEKTINNDVVPGAQLLGISFDDVNKSVENLVSNSQKFTIYQGETLLQALKISAAYGESARSILESAESFRNVGISLADATKDIENIGDKSISQGLSARATTKTVTDNIEKLNSFGFKNGVEGLANMVRQAQSLRFSMDETFKVANKVFDPEGAIELSANLQVLGGAFGDLADPIKLMYDATNNMESLQTSILGAARNLATYNAEQGRFEVTGANLRRAKAMADAMGVSMEQLTSAAIKGQVQMQTLSEIELFDLTDDQKQFVSNLASMKGGVIGFDVSKDMAKSLGIKEGFLSLQSLTGDQLKAVAAAQQKLADKTPEQLIRDQFTVATQSLNALNSIAMNIGNMARKGIQESDVYGAFVKKAGGLDEIAKMSPEEIEAKYNEVVQGFINPTLDKLKKMGSSAFDAAAGATETLIEKTKEATGIDLKTLPEDLKKKSEPLIERGREILRDVFDLNVRVDINSNSTQLAGIVVDEISKNPQLRAEFVSNIVKSTKTFA